MGLSACAGPTHVPLNSTNRKTGHSPLETGGALLHLTGTPYRLGFLPIQNRFLETLEVTFQVCTGPFSGTKNVPGRRVT